MGLYALWGLALGADLLLMMMMMGWPTAFRSHVGSVWPIILGDMTDKFSSRCSILAGIQIYARAIFTLAIATPYHGAGLVGPMGLVSTANPG